MKGNRSSVQPSGFVGLGITSWEGYGYGRVIESFPGLNVRDQLLTGEFISLRLEHSALNAQKCTHPEKVGRNKGS